MHFITNGREMSHIIIFSDNDYGRKKTEGFESGEEGKRGG